jgi:hypothetical protein
MSDASTDAKISPLVASRNFSALRELVPVLPIVFTILGFLGAALAAGFLAGMSTYKLWLEITQKDEVPRGSYVLKKDIRGSVLTIQAKAQLDDLIKQSKADEAWLLESKTFIAGLEFGKNDVVAPQMPSQDDVHSSSCTSSPLTFIFYAQSQDSLEVQTQRTLGVLRGVQRLYNSTPQ